MLVGLCDDQRVASGRVINRRQSINPGTGREVS